MRAQRTDCVEIRANCGPSQRRPRPPRAGPDGRADGRAAGFAAGAGWAAPGAEREEPPKLVLGLELGVRVESLSLLALELLLGAFRAGLLAALGGGAAGAGENARPPPLGPPICGGAVAGARPTAGMSRPLRVAPGAAVNDPREARAPTERGVVLGRA